MNTNQPAYLTKTITCYNPHFGDNRVCKVYRVKKSVASLNKKSNTIPYGTMRLEIGDSHMYHMVLGGIENLKGR